MSLSKRIVRSGALVSAVVFVLVNLAASTAQGQTYQEKVLYSFMGGADGLNPAAGLVRDPAGNLYGTTEYGGAYYDYGTVFEVSASGVESVLYSFTGGADGSEPDAGLVRDAAGNLYGTTTYGGNIAGYYGSGVVFKVSAGGVESVLYTFTGGADGSRPHAGLVRDPAGNLYGTTYLSGAYGYGTVFEVSASGVESVLYSFTGGADGSEPDAGLVRDAAGNLYGTTPGGGASGYGTVFEVTASGAESVLYSFTGGVDGKTPDAGLVRDAAGNIYGTTYYGGASGDGTVFEVSASGVESVLYSFTGGADGGYPDAGLIRNAAGNLYGTTHKGGSFGGGTVFRVSASGIESVLHSFGGGADGKGPLAGLIRDAAGNLYGTTYEGGAYDYGTVFELVRSASAP